MDLRKLAKIIKNSDMDEDDLFSFLKKIDIKDEQFLNFIEKREKINMDDYRESRKHVKIESKKMINDYEKYLKEDVYPEFNETLATIIGRFKRDKERILDREKRQKEREEAIRAEQENLLRLQDAQKQLEIERKKAERKLRILQKQGEPLIIKNGINKANNLHYKNIMTQTNFDHAELLNEEAIPENDIQRLLFEAYNSLKDEDFDENKKIFVNIVGEKTKTYKSGINLEELKEIARNFNVDTDEFFEEYSFSADNVYGISIAYR